MQDSGGVRCGQAVGYAGQQLHDLPPARVLTLCPFLERAGVNVFRYEILAPLELPDVMHCHNVRMIQRRGHLRLTLESPARGCIREIVGEDLHGHRSIELGVERPVDSTHATLAELRFNAVGANERADGNASTIAVANCPLVGVHVPRVKLGTSLSQLLEAERSRLQRLVLRGFRRSLRRSFDWRGRN